MGQEILTTRFHAEDFTLFRQRLERETDLLREWAEGNWLAAGPPVGGFELEAWLVDSQFQPAGINAQFLAALNSDQVVPELAKFNVELNNPPRILHGNSLQMFHADLGAQWRRCGAIARQQNCHIMMIGILPTVTQQQLNLDNMSDQNRYRALNEQVFYQRQGRPLRLDIPGTQPLHIQHSDVMLEAAATSFQIHLQVPAAQFVRYFNSAIVISGIMAAISANSPYLFQHQLWEETRIPLFEQAVSVGGYDGAAHGPIRRVTFGSDYLHHSVLECFTENLQHYPILLPILFNSEVEQLTHLRMHNGTLWRWNRPLVGFDDDGKPHLRLEHRVVPAGPTIVDEIANAAFFFGLVQALATRQQAPERVIPFSTSRDNFYLGARAGLAAQFTWLEKQKIPAKVLCQQELLPLARAGLASLGIDAYDSKLYLDIIAERLRTEQTGAAWQRAYVAKHGANMHALTRAYYQHQRSCRPVHEWEI